MKIKELIESCEKLICTFDPDKVTPDSHAEIFLKDYDSRDRMFLQQVFYGTYRYRELLKPLLTEFLSANSSRVSRNDYTKFMIIAYLAMFRLEELTFNAFATIVKALDPISMHVFLSHLFDTSKLHGPIRAEWNSVLDQQFVEQEIISKMLNFSDDVNMLLEKLHAKAFGRAAAKEARRAAGGVDLIEKKALTVPVSPNIRKPRMPKVHEPMRIPQRIVANPVPATINTLTLADLEKQTNERKLKVQEAAAKKLEEANRHAFRFECMARSNLEQVRKEVEDQRAKECQFDFKSKEIPTTDHLAPPKEIKLNIAAILREDALYRKKQAKEAQLIQAYETELRDPTEFYRWQSEMIAQDKAKRKQEVETRRLETLQTQYDAMEAALKAKEENRQLALVMKATSKELESQRLQEQANLEATNVQLVSQVKYERETAPRQAGEQVKQEKHKQREELNAFLAEEKARKAHEDAIEKAQREDLIRQIRALDRVHKENVVVFDPTETAQLGLLEEMSLAELRERLVVCKAEQLKWENSRREAIEKEKTDKTASLVEKMANLGRLRKSAATANAQHRQLRLQKIQAEREADDETRKRGNIALAKKLQEQRKGRLELAEKLKQEAEETAKKRMFIGAAKSMLEESHFDQLKQGAERKAKEQQSNAHQDALITAKVKQETQSMRIKFQQQIRTAHDKKVQEQQKIFLQTKDESKLSQRQEMDKLTQIVSHEQKRFRYAKGVLESRNMYATRQIKETIARNRAIRTLNQVKQTNNQLDK